MVVNSESSVIAITGVGATGAVVGTGEEGATAGAGIPGSTTDEPPCIRCM